MPKIVLTGASGNLGSRVLRDLLGYKLVPASDLIIVTSSSPERIPKIAHENSIEIRHGDFKNPSTLSTSFHGADVLFLVSYPEATVERWLYHKAAIDAARSSGVKTIVYTSLMFGGETGLQSSAIVHTGHIKTVEYLKQEHERTGLDYVVIREGIYAESWWFYLGFQPKTGFKKAAEDNREIDVVIPNDGIAAWVSWEDLSLGTAKILANYEKYIGQDNIRLTGSYTSSLTDIAKLVEKETGRKVNVRLVGVEETVRYHEERKSVSEEMLWLIRNWASWFEAIGQGEMAVVDPFLEELIGKKPRGIVEMGRELFVAEE